MKLSYEIRHGFGYTTVDLGTGPQRICSGYSAHSLRDLLDAVADICEGAIESHCRWQQAPGECTWRFYRYEKDVVVEIDRALESLPVLATRLPVVAHAKSCLSAAEDLLLALDEDTGDGWVTHSFPHDALERLRSSAHEARRLAP